MESRSSSPSRRPSPLKPIDVYRGYDVESRLLGIETDDVRVRIHTVEEEPVHVEELEDLLGGFLEQVERAVGSDCDLSCLVAACERYTVREPEISWVVLALYFKDLLRNLSGQRLRS